MSAKPVLIAQISDLHIKPPDVLAYGRVDEEGARYRLAPMKMPLRAS